MAGARAGLSGTRSGLFMEQIRIIKEMREADKQRGRSDLDVRPRYGIWENVPGAFSSAEGEDFRLVLQAFLQIEEPSLHVIGPADGLWEYAGIVLGDRSCVAWVTWDAQYLGVPQRRRRIFLVADFAAYSPIEILFIPESLQGDFAPGRGAGQAAAGGIADGAGTAGGHIPGLGAPQGRPNCPTPWGAQKGRIYLPQGTAPAKTGADGGGGRNPAGLIFAAGFSAGAGSSAGSIAYSKCVAPTLKGSASGNCMPSALCLNDRGGQMDYMENLIGMLRAQEHGHSPLVMPCGLYENHGIDGRYRGPLSVAPTLSARAGTGGNNLSLITQSVFVRCRADHFVPDNILSTQSARQNKDATDLVLYDGAADTPLLIRRLTPLECERLQGFPDGWTDLPDASDSARYRALGNSVAIPCVEYLMRRIALSLLLGFRGNLCSLW